MPGYKIVAILLIVGGVLALLYGGFSYAEEKHDIGLGPIELQVTEKERVDVPQWLGIAGIVVGGAMLLIPGKKS